MTHNAQEIRPIEVELVMAPGLPEKTPEEELMKAPEAPKPSSKPPELPRKPQLRIAAAEPAAPLPQAQPQEAQEEEAATFSAPPATPAEPARAVHASLSALSRDQTLQSFAETLWRRILRFKPTHLTAQGTAIITFTLGADGRLLSALISTSSGNRLLDGAALETVHLAQPFPPRPLELGSEPLTFTLPFRFQPRSP